MEPIKQDMVNYTRRVYEQRLKSLNYENENITEKFKQLQEKKLKNDSAIEYTLLKLKELEEMYPNGESKL